MAKARDSQQTTTQQVALDRFTKVRLGSNLFARIEGEHHNWLCYDNTIQISAGEITPLLYHLELILMLIKMEHLD
ncbi:MAG: hypothetical protein CM15mP34_2470 [Gammaproteobacteria bacterium]|nr:MAG: hypothetical protein CM15mP34_2470 [Gammaproteobacteria bacterium]